MEYRKTDRRDKSPAPALRKGLEILELLSTEPRPLKLPLICTRLGRSRSEIMRMVQELESRGYVVQDQSHGYTLSNKLFSLGIQRPSIKTLLEVALPVMRELSDQIWQSCHLAVLSGAQMSVIARVEAPTPVSFSTRVGHHQLVSNSSSGLTIYAYQNTLVQRRIESQLRLEIEDFDVGQLRAAAGGIRQVGYNLTKSQYIKGVTDISVPILLHDEAVAALTAPCISVRGDSLRRKDRIHYLTEAGKRISELSGGI